MKRRLMSLLLLLSLVLSTLSGCGAGPVGTAAELPLHWDGAAMTGAPFQKRTLPRLTVHYAKPTLPSVAERLGTMVGQFLDKHQSWGRLLPGERVDLWVIPAGYGWPTEIHPLDRRDRFARAVKPRVVVLEERVVPADVQDVFSMEHSGVYAAVATAVTQRETSPAYTIAWLHDGMGGVFAEEWRFFPGGSFTRDFAGNFSFASIPKSQAEILYVLDDANPLTPLHMRPHEAAAGLAALVMDRWGIDWPEHYARTTEELTPNAALLWATGAPNEGAAIKSTATYMKNTMNGFFFQGAEVNYRVGISLVDRGRTRLTPEPVQPANSASDSARTYRIAADWDPATRTISGEERLTWTNDEGVPLTRLYFNVWGNATPMLWFGGFTTVESVEVDGRPVAFTFRGMDLDVPLGRSVGPGQTAEVAIRFATRLSAPVPQPPHVKTANPVLAGTNAQTEDVWPLTLWYPALAVLDQQGWHLNSFPVAGEIIAEPADYEVRIAVPPGSQVSWPYINTKATPDGERTVYHAGLKGEVNWWGRILVDK